MLMPVATLMGKQKSHPAPDSGISHYLLVVCWVMILKATATTLGVSDVHHVTLLPHL